MEVINQRKDGSRFWNQVISFAVWALCLERGGADLHAFSQQRYAATCAGVIKEQKGWQWVL